MIHRPKRYYNGMIGEVVAVNDAGIIVRGRGINQISVVAGRVGEIISMC